MLSFFPRDVLEENLIESVSEGFPSYSITSDSQVNSNFPCRWSLANITINNYFYLFIYLHITRITINNEGGAMVLVKLPVPGRPTIWITVGQGPTALTVGAGGGCLDIFTLIYPSSPLSPSLWETVRYRLKYCLKGPLNPKQPTNHK